MARRRNRREQPQQDVNGTVQRDEDAAAMAELKEFVKEMRHSKGRSVEMRLAVLGSIVIIVKLFYFEGIFQSEAAYGVFFFLLGEWTVNTFLKPATPTKCINYCMYTSLGIPHGYSGIFVLTQLRILPSS